MSTSTFKDLMQQASTAILAGDNSVALRYLRAARPLCMLQPQEITHDGHTITYNLSDIDRMIQDTQQAAASGGADGLGGGSFQSFPVTYVREDC